MAPAVAVLVELTWKRKAVVVLVIRPRPLHSCTEEISLNEVHHLLFGPELQSSYSSHSSPLPNKMKSLSWVLVLVGSVLVTGSPIEKRDIEGRGKKLVALLEDD